MINPEELVQVVDENDRELEPLPRSVVRAKKLWCRTAHIWVINDQGKILCHQRSLAKDSLPGLWTYHFGGHNAPGESYEAAAIKELIEESGIKVSEADLTFYTIHKWEAEHRFQAVFWIRWNGDISELKLEKDEVEQAAWLTIDEIAKSGYKWTNYGYEQAFLRDLATKL